MQILVEPRGAGCKRKFPNQGKARRKGRTIGGTRAAKYLGALFARTGSRTKEVRSRILKATSALTKVARRMWNR